MNPVRFSHLRAYGKSPLHGYTARERDSDSNYAMERGTAVHAMLFETKKVCGYPGATRRGKDYESFVEEHKDHEILTMAEFNKASLMVDAIRQCKVAEPVLKGVREDTLHFRWNGLDCRATPDIRGDNFLTELKTSTSVDPMRFPWHALRMAYHAQMRMQQIASKQNGDCFIVAVESNDPFPVQVFRIDEKALLAGEKLLVLWSERLKSCEAANHFPAYSECIMPIDLPEQEDDLIFPEDEDGN